MNSNSRGASAVPLMSAWCETQMPAHSAYIQIKEALRGLKTEKEKMYHKKTNLICFALAAFICMMTACSSQNSGAQETQAPERICRPGHPDKLYSCGKDYGVLRQCDLCAGLLALSDAECSWWKRQRRLRIRWLWQQRRRSSSARLWISCWSMNFRIWMPKCRRVTRPKRNL